MVVEMRGIIDGQGVGRTASFTGETARRLAREFDKKGEPLADYYSRESHDTSLQACAMTLFSGMGGLMAGVLTSLFCSGWPVWLATGLGAVAGLLVYSLCVVAGQADEEMKNAECGVRNAECGVRNAE